jgi:hypothetical protein
MTRGIHGAACAEYRRRPLGYAVYRVTAVGASGLGLAGVLRC